MKRKGDSRTMPNNYLALVREELNGKPSFFFRLFLQSFQLTTDFKKCWDLLTELQHGRISVNCEFFHQFALLNSPEYQLKKTSVVLL